MGKYKVLVEFSDGDGWDKHFDDADEAFDFYGKCSKSCVVHQERATMMLQYHDANDWATIAKSEIRRKDW